MNVPVRSLFAIALAALASVAADDLRAEDLRVVLDEPTPFDPVFGPTELVATVLGSPAPLKVVFSVDGTVVGELEEPPYRMVVDLGKGNRSHQIEVHAMGPDGILATDSVSTPLFQIDETVDVDLQQLFVIASRDGKRVLDLDASDFEVFDDGRRESLVTFARGDIPFTATVLLDASFSMHGQPLTSALAGAKAFFLGLQPLDEAALVVFADEVSQRTPFTTYKEVLTAGLGGVRARGGTAIHDQLYAAFSELQRRPGRPVIILLSDGVDSHSALEVDEVARKAARSQALLYWIRLPHPMHGVLDGSAVSALVSNEWRDRDTYRSQLIELARIVGDTGGRIVPIESSEEIEGAFASILSELREQYVLGFYPSRSRGDGSWHELEVRVRQRGIDVRARAGYVDTRP